MSRFAKEMGEESKDVGLQMAPMINVMLVMLAVFVAGFGFVQQELQLDGGKLGGGGAKDPLIVMKIQINDSGEIFLNRVQYDSAESQQLPQFKNKLQNITSKIDDQPFLLVPQDNVSHERVLRVLEVCHEAGVRNVSLAR